MRDNSAWVIIEVMGVDDGFGNESVKEGGEEST